MLLNRIASFLSLLAIIFALNGVQVVVAKHRKVMLLPPPEFQLQQQEPSNNGNSGTGWTNQANDDKTASQPNTNDQNDDVPLIGHNEKMGIVRLEGMSNIIRNNEQKVFFQNGILQNEVTTTPEPLSNKTFLVDHNLKFFARNSNRTYYYVNEVGKNESLDEFLTGVKRRAKNFYGENFGIQQLKTLYETVKNEDLSKVDSWVQRKVLHVLTDYYYDRVGVDVLTSKIVEACNCSIVQSELDYFISNKDRLYNHLNLRRKTPLPIDQSRANVVSAQNNQSSGNNKV